MGTTAIVLELVILAAVLATYLDTRKRFKAAQNAADRWAQSLLQAVMVKHKEAAAEPENAQILQKLESPRTKGDTLSPKRAFQSIAQRRAAAVQAMQEEQDREQKRVKANARAMEG